MKPPQDIDAEQYVLGALLLDNTRIDDITLKPDDFYRESHSLIYKAILELNENNQPFDYVTVHSKLGNDAAMAGGASYIAQLPSMVPTASNITYYANIVKEKSLQRKLISLANKATAGAYEGKNVSELIEETTEGLIKLTETGGEIKDIKQQVIETVEAIQNKKPGISGLSTGLMELDWRTGGLHGSQLVVIAARPAMGKSALALNIGTSVALSGKTVAFFSLEMSDISLLKRIISNLSNVPADRLKRGGLTDVEIKKTTEAAARIHKTKLVIDDEPGLTVQKLRAKCRKIKRKQGLDLVIIDFLQLMEGKGNNREQEVSGISRGLKLIAKELNVPVIALSQLSRAVENRENKRPVMSDLRESGSIEQNSDIIMFLYRDEYYNKESQDKGIAELIIGKQREGETGTVKLSWYGQYQRFESRERGM